MKLGSTSGNTWSETGLQNGRQYSNVVIPTGQRLLLRPGGLDGQSVQLDVHYGTDPSINGFGFRFDEVTVTDVSFLVADTQPDECGGPTSTATTTTAASTTTTTTTTTTTLPESVNVHVASIVTGTLNEGGGNKRGTATVAIFDNNENPAGVGYTVTGNFDGDINQTGATGVTGADGTVTIQTSGQEKSRLKVSFCVTDVTVNVGLPYQPSGNTDPNFACPP